ncbi:MAG TPA: efflux transporter outer membrane subunit [Ramlibacter sp.]|uniref:efflux transporter outer membrane subunit n=1 Tax=Ramlibacter sp. TaxID=1917967 RepID=UPI002CDDBD76|nr:efflux transporter outer membrane subunit [Ramlibacter sp.]HVZ42834.1 efflux transporter outer membrane subunit [Ramlibacter sp.]
MRISFVPVAVFVTAGCAVHPLDVAPHGVDAVPAQWTEAAPAGTAASAQWWRVFDDPLLIELVMDARSASTDVAIARANLRQARAARDEAASALAPALSLGVSAQRSALAGGKGRDSFQVGVDAGWEADLFGGTRHGVAAQDALLRADADTLAAVQVAIEAEVALAYVDLRSAQVRARIARDNLASQEDTLSISRWRAQAGLASSIDVEQALGAAEQTRATIPALEAAAAQSAHAIAVLTGRAPGALRERLASGAAMPAAREVAFVVPPAQALRQRADVRAAEEKLAAAAERVAAADAARMPSLQLAASAAWSGLTLGSIAEVSAARSLLASLSAPLFDAGRLKAQLAGREAEFEAAYETYRASVLGALQEVEDALVALSSARERLAALRTSAQAARNAELLASQRYAGGVIDFQTVLDTQRTLLGVQGSVAAAQADLAAAHVRLYKAMGGGWRESESKLASKAAS